MTVILCGVLLVIGVLVGSTSAEYHNNSAALGYQACAGDLDCPEAEACVQRLCKDPCVGACGEGAECRVIHHHPACYCPDDFVGNPYTQCEPHKRLECQKNALCPETHAWIDGSCKDPCPGFCGENAVCTVRRHFPACTCKRGFTGDPHQECHTPRKRVHLHFENQLSWHGALLDCRARGMELVTVDNQEDFNNIHRLIKEYEKEFQAENTAFWTSGLQVADTEDYVWVSTGGPVVFKNWGPGDPNFFVHGTSVERCIVLWPNFDYQMGDYECRFKLYHACQEYV